MRESGCDMKQLIIVFLITLLMGCQAKAEPTNALKPTATIPLDGVQGRIDHMAVDATNGRLYVAALGNNTVEVIDLKAGKRIGQIAGLKKPQGMAGVTGANPPAHAPRGEGQ